VEVHKAQAFLAVAEELHFGRAAQRLHMAQPPLSRLIRQLESELGAVLFERSTRQVALTAQGEALLEPSRELVMLSQRMKEIVKRSQEGEIGRVRLGFAGASVSDEVGKLARHVRQKRPGISLELHTSQFSHLALEKVLDKSLDLVIGRWDFLPAGVDSRVIAHEELFVALPDSHRLADSDAVTAEQLADEPWIVLPGGSGAALPNRLNKLGVTGRFVPRIVQIGPDSSTMLLLVAAEVGIALTLSGVRDNVPARGVVYRPLRPDQGAVEVRLVWRRNDPAPALRRIIQLSGDVFGPDELTGAGG
jgi:DNA-binding transcriptional LysR family regulator